MFHNAIIITITHRSVPKFTDDHYPIVRRNGKEWVVDDHGGWVRVDQLHEAEVEFERV
ncbi:hypothetical protein [Citrobacter phage Tr1]|nr:hypothetical protein [Citrobacter phage Tr1]